jgi:hypothetical protein
MLLDREIYYYKTSCMTYHLSSNFSLTALPLLLSCSLSCYSFPSCFYWSSSLLPHHFPSICFHASPTFPLIFLLLFLFPFPVSPSLSFLSLSCSYTFLDLKFISLFLLFLSSFVFTSCSYSCSSSCSFSCYS